MDEDLEGKVSKFSRIIDEFKQASQPQNRKYFSHYVMNALKILTGGRPTDYRNVSHENALAGSFVYGVDDRSESGVSEDNQLVGADMYLFE